MENYFIPGCVLVLMVGCSFPKLQSTLGDSQALLKIYPADQLNIGQNFSSGKERTSNQIEITITNLHDGPYSNLSNIRLTSCVALSYYKLHADSVMDGINGVNVSIEEAVKKGMVTTSTSKSGYYTTSDLRTMDTLFQLVSNLLAAANAQKSFRNLPGYIDTSILADSVIIGGDSVMSAVFEKEERQLTFMGYRATTNDSGENAHEIWVASERGDLQAQFRFIISSDKRLVTGFQMTTE